MTRRHAIRLLVGATASALAGCSLFPQHSSFRVRMTVEVQTPEGVRTGSSVIEMVANTRIAAGTQSDARYLAGLSRGEAVAIDLPGGPIFALLTMPDSSTGIADPIFDALSGGARLTNDDMMSFVQKMGASGARYRADLPRAAWPMMIRFGDINDPKSVERVDPDAIGVKRIALETTSDAVTLGLAKRLPWLLRLKGGYLSGRFTSRGSPLGLHGGFFSTEIK